MPSSLSRNQSVNFTTVIARALLILPVLVTPFACIIAVLLEIDPSQKLAELLLPNMFKFKRGIGQLIPPLWRITLCTWIALQFLAAGNFVAQFGVAVINTVTDLLTALVDMSDAEILHDEDKLWAKLGNLRTRRIKIWLYKYIQIYWDYIDANVNARISSVGLSFGGLSQVVGNYFIVRFWDELPAIIYGTVTMFLLLMGVTLQVGVDSVRNPYKLSNRFLHWVKMGRPTKYNLKVINSLRPLEVSIGVFIKVRMNTGLIVCKVIADGTFTVLLAV